MNKIIEKYAIVLPFAVLDKSYEETFSALLRNMEVLPVVNEITIASKKTLFRNDFARVVKERLKGKLSGEAVAELFSLCLSHLCDYVDVDTFICDVMKGTADKDGRFREDKDRGFVLEVEIRECAVTEGTLGKLKICPTDVSCYVPVLTLSSFHYDENGDIVKKERIFTGGIDGLSLSVPVKENESDNDYTLLGMPSVDVEMHYDFGEYGTAKTTVHLKDMRIETEGEEDE